MAGNELWFGDNLHVLREQFGDASIDLVYLDPPFNSKRDYNVLFKERSGSDSEAQIQAFTDTWSWDEAAVLCYVDVTHNAPEAVRRTIVALRDLLGPNDLLAYLVNMAVRLVELHRVLKPTGSLYLHCDPTASHYLKVILDAIFGPKQFRNEIVWKRTTAHNDANRFGRIHDVLLFYGKSGSRTFNRLYQPISEEQRARYKYQDERGWYRAENLTAPHYSPTRTVEWRGIVPGADRQWRFGIDELERLLAEGLILLKKNGSPRKDGLKEYLADSPGSPLQDIWTDIKMSPTAGERLGYPTQKPLALLERIVAASSNPGDIVLDPFCGCGTATVAAEKLGRNWAGIDVTYLAIQLVERRLREMFPEAEFAVRGVPTDVEGARALAQRDPFSFQYWSLGLVEARPTAEPGRKGADRGIDGELIFSDDRDGRPKRVIVSVKGGERFTSAAVRDLRGTVERERAEMGLLLTLKEPTREMMREAHEAGRYRSEGWGRDFPRLQIATIGDIFAGKGPQLPPVRRTFSRSQAAVDAARQPGLAGL